MALQVEEATETAVERASHLGPTRMPGPSAVLGGFLDMGLTILTMTDCNTVEGIFSLYRQGNGGMANKHADKLYKEIKKYL